MKFLFATGMAKPGVPVGTPLLTEMADPPGTPLAEQVTDIGARLKEIEAERAKERQAGRLPEPANVVFKEIWR